MGHPVQRQDLALIVRKSMFARIRVALAVLVVSNSLASLHAQSPILAVPGRAFSVAGAGDVNLDGVPDFIVGIADTSAGEARVWSGLDGSLLYVFHGDASGDQAGYSVCAAGDVDGDGHADVAVGINASDIPGLNAGIVRVYSGADGSVLREFHGATPSALFGYSIALAGDCNGDGYPDLVVGSPYENHAGVRGSARLYSGFNGALLWVAYGQAVDDNFGVAVASAGDIDQDGYADVIVGANQSTNGGLGYATVISGHTGLPIFTVTGDVLDDRFGSAVAGGGDLNGDGWPDFLVAAPLDGTGGNLGLVRCFSGVDGSVLYSLRAGGFFGTSLAVIGDVNADGAADFIVGAPNDAGGRAIVFSGRTGHTLYRLAGSSTTELFGGSVASAGDVDSDEVPDVLVGARNGSLFGSGIGYARVFSGFDSPPRGYCTAKVNSLGCTPTISHYGVPTYSGDDSFRIEAHQVLNDVPGMLVFGSGAAATPLFGGTVCVDGTLIRTAVQSSGGSSNGADCSGQFRFPVSQASMLANGWLAGTKVYAQCWSRDPGFAPPDNISLTAGLAFTVGP
jgi:hypothetical protein